MTWKACSRLGWRRSEMLDADSVLIRVDPRPILKQLSPGSLHGQGQRILDRCPRGYYRNQVILGNRQRA